MGGISLMHFHIKVNKVYSVIRVLVVFKWTKALLTLLLHLLIEDSEESKDKLCAAWCARNNSQ